jgi:phage protein D
VFENKISVNSISRQPRGIVQINGINVFYTRAEVDSTTNFCADTFSVEIPISGQNSQITPAYMGVTGAMMVEIFAGFPTNPDSYTSSDLDSLILGQVDNVEINWLTRSYTLTGRDLTAKFIDNKTTKKYPNLTASEIVTMLAKEQGLSAQVTPTQTLSGVFYANNHTTLTSEQPEWDLITFLAQQEGFVAYVKDTTLYFEPEPKETDEPYLLQYNYPGTNAQYAYTSANVITLKTSRSLTLARDVIVKVRSWNSSQKRAFTITVRATPNKKTALASKAQPIGDAQVFTQTIPGLTREQALQKAQQLLKQYSQHERRIEAQLVGDNILKKVGVVKLRGTQTDYDQVYFTSSVNRVLSPNSMDGYIMTVHAKNHSPNSQVVI